MIIQDKSGRKKTGGLLRAHSKKMKHMMGREFTPVLVNEEKKKPVRVRGGSYKIKLAAANMANVVDASGKTARVKIVTVKENPANPNYIRRNIMTKGAVIQTELGLARITSRPGQDGVVNAKLIEKA